MHMMIMIDLVFTGGRKTSKANKYMYKQGEKAISVR